MKFSLVLPILIIAALATTLEGEHSLVEDLSENTFDNYLTVSKLAIVDFFAPW